MLDPYAVFVATGADAFVPPIDGAEGEHVFTTTEILNGSVNVTGQTIAVIGSGMTGLETAELLAAQGTTVKVYEMAQTIGSGAYFQNLIDVTTKLQQHGVELHAGHKLQIITDDGILLGKLGNAQIIEKPVDAVVLSLGVRPNNQMVDSLKSFSNVKVIGDVNAPRKIAQAIKEGCEEAYKLEVRQAVKV